MSRTPRGFADQTETVPEDRCKPRSLDVEQGDEVEIGFSRTGPCRVVSGSVSTIYGEDKFAVSTGESPIHDLSYIVSGDELRSGTFADGHEKEGRVSYVAPL